MLTFIDLFCGGGFGARGAVRGGGQPLLGIDAWELATLTYKANFPRADVMTDRIEALDPASLKDYYQPDVLLASPECTSHSVARGGKPGVEASRASALVIPNWISALHPRWFVMENVNRMKRWHGHSDLVRSIEHAGYTLSDLYLTATDFGGAQARRRMFLIGSRDGHTVNLDDLYAKPKTKGRIARDILDRSARYSTKPLYRPGRARGTIERAERAIAALGPNKPFLIVYYGSDYAGGWQPLTAPLRTVTTLDRFGLVTWRRSEPLLRMLQPEELKRAMGAGDEHVLPFGSRREKIKLCGNGVCSEVMEALFRHIARIERRTRRAAA